MKSGIYKITCLLNNQIYIGYSVNLEKREKSYKNNNIPNQKHIKNSINSFGWENHKFEIIEYCEKNILKEKEIYWITYHNSFINGLNGNRGGGGPITHTEEIKKIISEKSKNNKGKRINSHWKGKSKGEEFSKKVSMSLSNKKSHWKGKSRGEEFSKKLSKAKKGKPLPLNNKPILQYSKEGTFIQEHISIEQAAKYVNGNPSAISNALKKGEKYSSCGFVWKFK
jgi:group I intron endonuclease